ASTNSHLGCRCCPLARGDGRGSCHCRYCICVINGYLRLQPYGVGANQRVGDAWLMARACASPQLICTAVRSKASSDLECPWTTLTAALSESRTSATRN